MSDIAIQVQGLGKRYALGGRRKPYKTLRESLAEAVTAPFRRAARSGEPAVPTSFWALKDVNFTVNRGEVVGIIGRNGAGKSTLLKVLSRITDPTEGQVQIDGRVGSLLEVGTGFHPELSGRENVYLNGAILGMRRAEIARKFDEIVAFAETERFLDTPVKFYSSGMYTRLAFAVAAHLDPEILIVDEVLAVGDAEFQKKCLGKMRDVAQGGRTVLFVSHQMAAVQQLCTQCILLRAGRVHQQGRTADVVSEYLGDAVTASDGVFDLRSHPARHGRAQAVIQQVTMSGEAGVTTGTVYPDERVTIDITVVPTKPLREPHAAVAIEDSFGRRLMSVTSYFGGNRLDELLGPSVIRCVIPRLDLGSGRYLLSVSIGDEYEGHADSMDAVAWFEVGWRNNFGNGQAYNPVFGPVLKESTWSQVNGDAGTVAGHAR